MSYALSLPMAQRRIVCSALPPRQQETKRTHVLPQTLPATHCRPAQQHPPALSGRQAWCTASPLRRYATVHDKAAGQPRRARSALDSFTQQQEGGPYFISSPSADFSLGPPLSSSAAPPSLGNHPQSPSHALLTKRIKLCTTSQELAAVLEEHSVHFNNINVAAAMVQLAQLPPGPQPPPPGSNSATDAQAWDAYASYEALLQRVLQQVAGLVPNLGARQVANVMWAAARLGRRCPDGFHPMCASLMGLLLPQSQVMLPWCTPQELSSR